MANVYVCLQGGVKKGQKQAYVILEWSPSNVRDNEVSRLSQFPNSDFYSFSYFTLTK